MKRISVCLLFSWFLSNSPLAQDTLTFYYDKNWKEIPEKNAAVFYRKAFVDDNNTWSVLDYYISDKIQMTGTFKSKSLLKQGHFVYYYENGIKKSEGNYLNNKAEEKWCYWY